MDHAYQLFIERSTTKTFCEGWTHLWIVMTHDIKLTGATLNEVPGLLRPPYDVMLLRVRDSIFNSVEIFKPTGKSITH